MIILDGTQQKRDLLMLAFKFFFKIMFKQMREINDYLIGKKLSAFIRANCNFCAKMMIISE